MMSNPSSKSHTSAGFTLVELTIVLIIISLLVVAVVGSTTLINSAKASDLIAKAKDMTAAARSFRERYKFWPGDLPNAASSIANLPPACDLPTTTASIGDGVVNTATEISCAVEELFQAGMIKAEIQGAATLHTVTFDGIGVRLLGASASTVNNFPVGTNLVEFSNVRCEMVQSIDAKIDDGNIASTSTGRAKSSVASCTPGGANDSIPFYAVAIN